jgi:leader peptidase (prepilin peptidase)/N-methyltransferase
MNPVLVFEGMFSIMLGLIVGSFLNVCISRIPRQESVVFPSSHCPACGALIKPYDNIPVVSFLLLGGKCRTCRNPISWQYPLVELLTALIFWLTWNRWSLSLPMLIYWVFFSALIVLVLIDLYHRILPNVITLPGILAGMVASLFIPLKDGSGEFLLRLAGWISAPLWLNSLLDSLAGAAVCGGFLWAVAEAYFRIRKLEGMGFGDVKLMGMVGAFLGVKLALLTIMLGSFLGSVIGFSYIKLSGKDNRYELPFGSFLGLAAIIAALWGEKILGAYLGLLRGY